jgi:hypothetical protein
MAFLRMSGLALAAVLGLSLPIGQATAMPANGLAVAVKQVPKRAEDVRLVCGPYRCWSTGYWGYRPYAYSGWRRHYAYAGPYYGWRRPLYAYARPYYGWRRPLMGGVGRSMPMPGPIMAGVDRSTPMPVPITAGADHTTHMPDPVGVGVGRSMPMPEDPIGAGVDHSTQPRLRPVSASTPGTAVGILGTPAVRTMPMRA